MTAAHRALDQRLILSRHNQPVSTPTSTHSRPERPDPGGRAATFRGLHRKPTPLTTAMAVAVVLVAGTAATLVTLLPGARLAASATPAPQHRPAAAVLAGNEPVRAHSVVGVTATPRQDDQIRAVEAFLASHALGESEAVTLALSLPVTAAATPTSASSPAPAQQAGPVATVTAAGGSPQQIALAMLASYGWSSGQFTCLDALWQQESGWNVYASNPGSGAYGIPQALPGSKMASAGPDWETDAATQIRWGLSYIQATYGSPCAAWSHEESTGWY